MIIALVPAKALDQAKGRLAALLGEDERRQLALAMLEEVIEALKAVPRPDGRPSGRIDLTAVVSPDAEALALARKLGAEAIAEPPSVRGLNQALSHAAGVLASRRPDALLVIPADIPGVSHGDVDGVLDALPPDRGVVIVPSRDRGTGALALRPPDAIRFHFGPQSSIAHRREAAARGLPARVLRIEALAADIDGPDDLLDFLARPGDSATRRLLGKFGLAERLGAARSR